jgi:hypothetical protein
MSRFSAAGTLMMHLNLDNLFCPHAIHGSGYSRTAWSGVT